MTLKTPGFSVALALALAASSPAALVITEVMSSSAGAGAGATNGDWFELTNTGASPLNIGGYYWDDGGPSGNDGAIFPSLVINPGQSVVIVDENPTNLPAWLASWGGGFTAISSETFSGPNIFSGLGSSGDQIEIWDADPNAGPAILVASVAFGVAAQGSSFAWSTSSSSLGLSVNGVDGATTNTSGDIGSPGIAVPEPTSLLLGVLGLPSLIRRRR